MSGNKLLVDMNTVIGLLNKHPRLQPHLNKDWWYSFISAIELLGKPNISANEISVVSDLLTFCTKVPHSDETDEIAIVLKQKYALKTPDAIIAATALYHRLPLLTFDKDFRKVKELNLILLTW